MLYRSTFHFVSVVITMNNLRSSVIDSYNLLQLHYTQMRCTMEYDVESLIAFRFEVLVITIYNGCRFVIISYNFQLLHFTPSIFLVITFVPSVITL